MDADKLIRNQSGTAVDRQPQSETGSLQLESTIARNVREQRSRLGLSIAEAAERVGLSKAMLSKIENAQTSCSLRTLSSLADGLDIPVTSLFRGADEERQASYVEAGNGARAVRYGSRVGHLYELLGSLRGEHRRLECLLVTLNEDSETYPLFQHPGTEFIFMLEGTMNYSHSRTVYKLRPGDSLLFDGEGAHGPHSLGELPIRFLSVIGFPESASS